MKAPARFPKQVAQIVVPLLSSLEGRGHPAQDPAGHFRPDLFDATLEVRQDRGRKDVTSFRHPREPKSTALRLEERKAALDNFPPRQAERVNDFETAQCLI